MLKSGADIRSSVHASLGNIAGIRSLCHVHREEEFVRVIDLLCVFLGHSGGLSFLA